jgi:hypothetical protein
VIQAIRDATGRHQGDEKDLYEALVEEAESWKMRLQELEKEAEDGDEG